MKQICHELCHREPVGGALALGGEGAGAGGGQLERVVVQPDAADVWEELQSSSLPQVGPPSWHLAMV